MKCPVEKVNVTLKEVSSYTTETINISIKKSSLGEIASQLHRNQYAKYRS
jgi:hypothetical protein